jgi:hypothetical protein
LKSYLDYLGEVNIRANKMGGFIMDREAEAKITTDHEEIRQWAEARGGRPARVIGTGNASDTGMLRIDFPGYSGGETLEQISWEEFFEKFEESKLAFLYQEETKEGKESRFSKLISSDTKETKKSGAR